MKIKLLSVVLCVATYTSTFAQLKVSQSGSVGFGIDPRTDYKLSMKGNLMLTTFPEIPVPLTRYTEFRIKVGNGWPGCEFGTPTRKIAVWSSEVGYNDLYAAHYYTQSDASVKTEIEPLTNALELIQQINSYSFKMKYDTLIDDKQTLSFLAQEIHNVMPDMTDTAKGIMLVDYQQIIPLLLQAVKEQQNIIDSLRIGGHLERRASANNSEQQNTDSIINEINKLKEQISACCNLQQSKVTSSSSSSYSHSTLFQNRPNPFSEKTTIEFNILEKFRSASIMIFDMQGSLKKTILISQNGKGQITVNGFELTAGMYLYSLIIDDKEIDTKRMILMN